MPTRIWKEEVRPERDNEEQRHAEGNGEKFHPDGPGTTQGEEGN
jgi:hypothetical protein